MPASDLDETDTRLDLRERIALATLERRMLGGASTTPIVDGRYVLLEELGTGGMGVVRRAFDRQLRREVAMKFLRLGAAARRTDEVRLQREAQALALVSHPNVVAVYDVRATTEAFFLAMEFIEGDDLRGWLRHKARPRHAIIEVLLQAGRGLVAAHEAGLVHRDFKPSNVMIGHDHRVRVVDFGLARGAGTDVAAPTDGGAWQIASWEDLTRTGWLMGTPGYAAPEQLAGEEITARTDQFGFCVALYEALFGTRPFSAEQIATAARGGESPPLTFPSRAPRWLCRLLRRGLAMRPPDRWPSMVALTDALRRGSRRRRRGVATAAAVAAVAVVWAWAWDPPTGSCEDATRSIAAVWNADRAEALTSAFVATDSAYAAAIATRVGTGLDRYASDWAGASREACEATRVRREASEAALAHRVRCLQRRRTELAALVDVLIDADAETVRRANDAVADLVSVQRCRRRSGDGAVPRSVKDDSPAVRRVEQQIARARALDKAGRPAQAREIAHDALQEATILGEPKVAARARCRYGIVLDSAGDYAGAADQLAAAYFDALQVGARSVAAEAATNLVVVEGERRGRHDEALSWARHAHALLAEQDMGAQAEIRLLQVEALAHGSRGDYAEAARLNLRALELLDGLPDASPLDEAWTHNNLGVVYQDLERYEDALREHEQARALLQTALGPEHLDVAVALNGLGGDRLGLGQPEKGLALFRQVLAIRERELGSDHPDVASTHNNIGVLLLEFGEYDEAETHYRAALEILAPDGASASESPTPAIADLMYNLGTVEHFRGQHEHAIEVYRDALNMYRRIHRGDHPMVASTLNNIGVCYQDLGDLDEAERLHRRALQIREGTVGGDTLAAAQSLQNLGAIEVARGNHRAAIAPLQRALDIARTRNAAALIGDVGFLLAKSAAKTDHPTWARTLAEEAQTAYHQRGDQTSANEIQTWLSN